MKMILLGGLAAVLAAPSPTARAATYTWTGADSSTPTWSDANNWNPNAVPASDPANTDIVYGAGGYGNSLVNGLFSIHSLTWTANAPSYDFTPNKSGGLTVGAGGFVVNSSAAQNVQIPVTLGTARPGRSPAPTLR